MHSTDDFCRGFDISMGLLRILTQLVTSRQCLKRGYVFVICDRLGAHACTDVCIVFAQKIMSWYEVGGVMIGSIKRLNKLCEGLTRSALNVCTCMHLPDR